MKIVLTGSEGFIGQAVKRGLEKNGHTVVGFDIRTGHDMLKPADVEQVVGSGVDMVYHLAAAADLTKIKTLDDARMATDLNVFGTHNFAHACATHGVWLVYASTCCVYGNQPTHAPEFEDTTLPNPSEIYACTKLAGEEIIRGYGINFTLPYTILRFATIYGPGMRDTLAPAVFLRQAYAGEPITVHGTGEQERTQTYIEDLVEGIVAVAEHPEAKQEIINLTSEENVSVIRMAMDIKAALSSASEIVHLPDRKYQTYHENPAVQKARQLLGWKARTSWEEGIKKTAAWYLKTQEGGKK